MDKSWALQIWKYGINFNFDRTIFERYILLFATAARTSGSSHLMPQFNEHSRFEQGQNKEHISDAYQHSQQQQQQTQHENQDEHQYGSQNGGSRAR